MSIKLLNPNSVLKLVSVQDDAIDLANIETDVKKYGETGHIKHLRFLPDKAPTYFLARPIPADTQTEITKDHIVIEPGAATVDGRKVAATQVVHDAPRMMIRHFKAGVKQIEENGVVADLVFEEIPPSVVIEIGSYVYLLSNLGGHEKN